MTHPRRQSFQGASDAASTGQQDLDLAEILGTLVEAKWLVASVAFCVLAVGTAYAFIASPIFRADVMIQVEQKKNNLAGLEELSSMFSGESPAETEIQIIRSRSLVGAVVDSLKLDIIAEPRHFPIIGALFARRHASPELASPVLGLSSFAWGGERLRVERLDVPSEMLGKWMTVTAGAGGTYEVRANGDTVLRGKVGEAAAGNDVAMFVAELRARPGTEFRLMRVARSEAVRTLQEKLVIGEKGKKTGIMQAELEGTDPWRVTATLDAIARAYLRQNVERKSEDAEKTLDFINGQLPVVKANLESAEAALNAYQAKAGTMDLSMESEKMLERAVALDAQITELQMQQAELRQRFTDSHPSIESLRAKFSQLEAERANLNAKLKHLPDAELESVRLMRDVKVGNELYLLLLNKAQELKVVKSGTIGNVRIIDFSVLPSRAVSPNKPLVLILSLMAGLLLGAGVVLVHRAFTRGVEDPDVVERDFGLSIYGSIPLSEAQLESARAFKRRRATLIPVLAQAHPQDPSTESLRSLRTSLQFALMDAKNNIVMITGPSPGIGKSFVSTNLAHVLADAGKRVLLVDADMRRGHLHDSYGHPRGPGLSEVIAGTVDFETAVREGSSPNVSVLTTGVVPPNPSELLLSERFQKLLTQVSAKYDLVLLDTPPVLAVTDGMIIARSAGVCLMVLRSGQHHTREIGAALKRLEGSGVRPNGVIFNGVSMSSRRGGGRYSYHYQYDYR